MKTEKEKRTGFIRGLFLILTLGCCLLIFLNSAADSEVSGKQSGTITEALAPVVIPNYDQLSPGEQKTQKNELGSLVRKAGHCLEFMALGLCSFSFCLTFRKNMLLIRKLTIIPVGFLVTFTKAIFCCVGINL